MNDYLNLYRQTKRNAEKRDISFLLTEQEFKKRVMDSMGVCCLTGIPFDFSPAEPGYRRPQSEPRPQHRVPRAQ